jgi:hypothetical protein
MDGALGLEEHFARFIVVRGTALHLHAQNARHYVVNRRASVVMSGNPSGRWNIDNLNSEALARNIRRLLVGRHDGGPPPLGAIGASADGHRFRNEMLSHDCSSFFGFDSKDQPCSLLGKVLATLPKFKYIDLIN